MSEYMMAKKILSIDDDGSSRGSWSDYAMALEDWESLVTMARKVCDEIDSQEQTKEDFDRFMER